MNRYEIALGKAPPPRLKRSEPYPDEMAKVVMAKHLTASELVRNRSAWEANRGLDYDQRFARDQERFAQRDYSAALQAAYRNQDMARVMARDEFEGLVRIDDSVSLRPGSYIDVRPGDRTP